MAKEYMEPEKRYEDQQSSGVVFTLLGVVGILVTVLCFLDILKFPLNNFQLLILFAAFVCCIVLGVWSFKRAAEIKKTIVTENDYVGTIRAWIDKNRDGFCTSDTAGMSGSEIYFQREYDIREAISNQFPDIEEELLDLLVEETYQTLFEEA